LCGRGEPEDRDALRREDLHRMRPAALSDRSSGWAGAAGPPTPSIEDDLRPGVSSEPGLEIAIEPLLGGGDDDEVGARGVALDRSPVQRRSSQIW
jgi:hypothetical protein